MPYIDAANTHLTVAAYAGDPDKHARNDISRCFAPLPGQAAAGKRRYSGCRGSARREIVPGMAASATVPPVFSAPAIEEVCKVLGDA
jgi:hypothetical protein